MIITITNQKGGIGKTTTAQNLGYGLAVVGYKVLLVDLDAQRNLTIATGADQNRGNIHEVLLRRATAEDAIQPLNENLDIIAGTLDMAGLDLEINEIGKEYRLKEALEPIRGKYAFIIIDTPPALNITTMNALTAADRVIIPAQADIFSLDAIKQLYTKTLNAIKQYTNSGLIIDGILLTRFNDRNILTREIMKGYEALAEQLHTRVYETKIRDTVTIKESQAAGEDIYSYAGNSNVAADYARFTKEFIENL